MDSEMAIHYVDYIDMPKDTLLNNEVVMCIVYVDDDVDYQITCIKICIVHDQYMCMMNSLWNKYMDGDEH